MKNTIKDEPQRKIAISSDTEISSSALSLVPYIKSPTKRSRSIGGMSWNKEVESMNEKYDYIFLQIIELTTQKKDVSDETLGRFLYVCSSFFVLEVIGEPDRYIAIASFKGKAATIRANDPEFRSLDQSVILDALTVAKSGGFEKAGAILRGALNEGHNAVVSNRFVSKQQKIEQKRSKGFDNHNEKKKRAKEQRRKSVEAAAKELLATNPELRKTRASLAHAIHNLPQFSVKKKTICNDLNHLKLPKKMP